MHKHDHHRTGAAPHGHSHGHGAIDPSLMQTEQGMWAVKLSFVLLLLTAGVQVAVVAASGSVALFADTIHNIGDAFTAVPLWIAFQLARRKPSPRFTYGYGRFEDLAGVAVVLTILASAVVAGYESINRFFHPQDVKVLWAVAAASVIGFAGNEAVAVLRIRVGEQIGSAALVADGYHARVDGLTSLAVLFGAAGMWLGYPLADPLVGLLITLLILKITYDSAKAVFARLLDRIEPELVEQIRRAAGDVARVRAVTDIRARWVGHRIEAEVSVSVASNLSVEEAHAVATDVRHSLLHHVAYLGNAIVHIDPETASGNERHRVVAHEHDGLPTHSHAA